MPTNGKPTRSKSEYDKIESDPSVDPNDLAPSMSDLSKPSRGSGYKNDATGKNKERCKYCLKRPCVLAKLKNHVKTCHPEFYKNNKKEGRAFFVADSNQEIPDEPQYQVQPPQI